jgi:hypothetical protein
MNYASTSWLPESTKINLLTSSRGRQVFHVLEPLPHVNACITSIETADDGRHAEGGSAPKDAASLGRTRLSGEIDGIGRRHR